MKMNKHVTFILIILLLITIVSCNKLNNNKLSTEEQLNNDTIQMWCNFEGNESSEHFTRYIVGSAKSYCKENQIPLEIVEYNPNLLSYDDYILKRNLAALKGNMIIFDDTSNLIDLAKHHADYAKLKIYDSLLEPYKDKFCIPIGRMLKSSYIHNDILDYYNIDTSERKVITYIDYLELKQEMKKKGAKFEANKDDFYETVKYHLYTNGLLYVNMQDELLKNNDKLEETLKKSIFDMCEDIILYDDAKVDEFVQIDIPDWRGLEIYDSNSGLYLKEIQSCDYFACSSIEESWFSIEYVGITTNKTYIADYFSLTSSKHPFYGESYFYTSLKAPSFFMHKKISNEKIYDLVDYILEESGCIFSTAIPPNILYTPILYTEKLSEKIRINEDFEYIGRVKDEAHREVINKTYNIFAKDEIKSKEMADEYFADAEIVRSIEAFVYDTIREMAKKLSGSNTSYNLSLNRFDKNDEEINKLVDEKIDEFMQQLIVKLID